MAMNKKPKLIYDGDCQFCQVCIDYAKKFTHDQVIYQTFQSVATDHPTISLNEFKKSIQLISDSDTSSGAHAYFTVLHIGNHWKILLWTYEKIPGLKYIYEFGYNTVSKNRNFCYKLLKFFLIKK